ncbi:hypothetical protein VPH35_078911 [Triticum aestivum]
MTCEARRWRIVYILHHPQAFSDADAQISPICFMFGPDVCKFLGLHRSCPFWARPVQNVHNVLSSTPTTSAYDGPDPPKTLTLVYFHNLPHQSPWTLPRPLPDIRRST